MYDFTDEIRSRSPFVNLLGLSVGKREEGICQTFLDVRDEFLNSQGFVHGGVIYSMMDISMGTAVYSTLKPNEKTFTIEIKINYLKPSNAKRLSCTAKIIQKGKNIAVLEAEVRDETVLIAKAMGTFSVFKA